MDGLQDIQQEEDLQESVRMPTSSTAAKVPNGVGINIPQTAILSASDEPVKKGKRKLFAITTVIVAVVMGYLALNFLKTGINQASTSTTLSSGFKTVTGCIQPLGTNTKLNFQLDIPKDYDVYNPEVYGCGHSESSDIGYRIPGGSTTIAVGVFIAAGSSSLPDDMKDMESRFPVPAPNDKYFVGVSRDSVSTLSNKEWEKIKQSFVFK